MNYRICTKCGKEFEATTEFFYKNKTGKFGLQSWCIVCKKKWYKDNKERCAATVKKWQANNPDKVAVYRAKWKKSNPDKINASWAKRHARKLNQSPILTDSEDKQIKLFYKKGHELGQGWQVDHIKPLIKGGLHHPDNLQIVTASYNLQKGAKTDFRAPNKNEIFRIQIKKGVINDKGNSSNTKRS